jgi:protein phosphatase
MIKRQINILDGSRNIVISGVRGDYDSLIKLLDKVKYKEEDTLIFLGNIIEKGPKSLETIQFIQEISQKGLVLCVRGNSEENFANENQQVTLLTKYLPQIISRGYNSILLEAAKILNISLTTFHDVELVLSYLQDEIAFIKDMPYILESDKLVFAHAGIKEINEDYLSDEDRLFITSSPNYFSTSEINNRYHIIGHTPSPFLLNKLNYSPIYDMTRRIINIEGGNIITAGQLNALIIEKNDGLLSFTHRWVSVYPQILVEPSIQIESESEEFILIDKLEVRVIKRNDYETEVKSLVNGQEFLVPTKFVIEKDDKHYLLFDYTNHVHQISKMQSANLLYEDDSYEYLNVDGVLGWIKK